MTPTTAPSPLTDEDLADAWPVLSSEDRVAGFRMLPPDVAEEFFDSLDAAEQATLLLDLSPAEARLWIRVLEPDDAVDVVQAAPEERRADLLASLDESTRKEVSALLAYAEDVAGGLMSPRYARLRPDMRVDEAIRYLRMQALERLETIYYVYVVSADQRLLGVVSFRDLFAAPADKTMREIMSTAVVTAREDTDQEELSRMFAEQGYLAVPVVDGEGRMKGIVTVDDILDVVTEEATEDIQKIGGTAALEAPYLHVGVLGMLRKRAGWLVVLFFGQMITATAMAGFEDEIATAVILAVFLPLIISSGGNSGSQASTLVIRALALDEVRLRDWGRVFRREVLIGFLLGAMLGVLGLLRIVGASALFGGYGEHALLLGLTIGASILGVVLWGATAGAMLPFVLRRLDLDPASASAPFIATLVDVTGIMIYFSIAKMVLTGTIL
jgi:magnesium transporter